MAKLKIANRFGIIPNDLLNNPEISFRAKGLFGYLQSKPENWDFCIKRIKNDGKEGRDAVGNAIQELEAAGYLIRNKYQNDTGHWEMDYILYSEPHFEEVKNPEPENPASDLPEPEKPEPETPATNKKRNTKKEEEKKEEVSIPQNGNSEGVLNPNYPKVTKSHFTIAQNFLLKKYQKHHQIREPMDRRGDDYIFEHADAVDKMGRIDGLSLEQIIAILLFCVEDKFWSKNIMTPSKLREKNADNSPYWAVILDKMGESFEKTEPVQFNTDWDNI